MNKERYDVWIGNGWLGNSSKEGNHYTIEGDIIDAINTVLDKLKEYKLERNRSDVITEVSITMNHEFKVKYLGHL